MNNSNLIINNYFQEKYEIEKMNNINIFVQNIKIKFKKNYTFFLWLISFTFRYSHIGLNKIII